jgi:hypothetical protein
MLVVLDDELELDELELDVEPDGELVLGPALLDIGPLELSPKLAFEFPELESLALSIAQPTNNNKLNIIDGVFFIFPPFFIICFYILCFFLKLTISNYFYGYEKVYILDCDIISLYDI